MKLLLCLAMALTFNAAQAEGNHNLSNNSTASEISAFASVVVVLGTVEALGAAGTAVVDSVETVGDAVTVVFKGAANASRTTVRGSRTTLGKTSLAVGTSVNVVTMASGYALVSAGQVLAFFPNQAGKALMHQSRYQAPAAQ